MAVYEGSEKYIFVSYAHRDSAVVIPMINALQEAGYRVWYDQGIQAGTEWPEYIEDHLNKCSCVLICMSPATIDSINCRNEINYACMLKKDMLVVYLEQTKLAKGMNLQLNSQQSLFRNRHESDASFFAELVRAKVLKSCKVTQDGDEDEESYSPPVPPRETKDLFTDEDSSSYAQTVKSRIDGVPVISRVGTMGSNNPSEPWPRGIYSQSIDAGRFNSVHFHCNLIRPTKKQETRSVGIRIYDSRDTLIYESILDIVFNVGNDKFSVCWRLRDDDGLSQSAGMYTAVIWVDNSRAFEYAFQLSGEVLLDVEHQKEIETLKNKLMYPKLFFVHLIASIAGFVSIGCAGGEVGWFFLFGIAWIILAAWLCRLTRRHVVNKRFFPFLFSFIGFSYYGIFLFVMMIVTLVNKKAWLAKIEDMQARSA